MSGNPRSDRARSIGASPGGMQTPSAYWTIRDSLRGSPMPTRRQLANAIRALAWMPSSRRIPAIPGMPMGMADIAEVLWSDYLRAQSRQPALARPRPLRALERPRLDAAVLAAAPDRLRAADRRAEELPPARLAHRGPPGARLAPRHRDHDRPARPGPRQRGRHGARREAARGEFNRPGLRRSSITTPTCSSATAA